MQRRAIYCPGAGRGRGAWVPLGAYVAGIRKAKAHPDAQFPHSLIGWWPATGAEILAQFRRGMHERISAGQSYSARGVVPRA